MRSPLEELLARVKALDPEHQAELEKIVASIDPRLWFPNPGAQTAGYFSPADELFYGGAAGGGKTALLLGLALTEHRRSLILRRINKDAVKLVPFLEQIVGHRQGYNGQLQRWILGDRQVDIGGCEQESDKQRYKGDPHDFIGFDEGSDLLESQYRFIIGWNRSTNVDQRCRVVLAANPPTTPEGLWVIRYWAPWLDPLHPNPAKPGELRWFTTVAGEDREVDGQGPHLINGEEVMARSRTFIPARLDDNPDLARTGYASVLAGLPDELRAAYKEGRFDVGLKDDDFQVIPTAWIEEAQRRWSPEIPHNTAMTAIGLDVAQGGADQTVLAPRYGGWYAPLMRRPGAETQDGNDVASLVVRVRRDRCPVIVDVGGGWGGGTVMRLKENGIEVQPFNGANAVFNARTKDGSLGFINKRAEAWWRFREELDPNQEGGSVIALPPDASIKADLAAPRWKLAGTRGIQIESKIDIRARLGRSPDDGDAIIMSLSEGNRAQERMIRRRAGPMKVNLGYAALKRGAFN